MVEHAWVRIAEIREQAAQEAWEAAHPVLTRLRKAANLQRIRWLNWLKDFKESEHGKQWIERAQAFREARAAQALQLYLAVTRCVGRKPVRGSISIRRRRENVGRCPLRAHGLSRAQSRVRVQTMSTRSLMAELERRNIDVSDCIERRELIDSLCGEAADDDDECEELVAPSPVDKMV
jgi:hypothetical protein